MSEHFAITSFTFMSSKTLKKCFSLKKENLKWSGVGSRLLQLKSPGSSWRDGKCPDVRRSSTSCSRFSLRLQTQGSETQDFTTLVHQIVMKIPCLKNLHRNRKTVCNLLLSFELIGISNIKYCRPWMGLHSNATDMRNFEYCTKESAWGENTNAFWATSALA